MTFCMSIKTYAYQPMLQDGKSWQGTRLMANTGEGNETWTNIENYTMTLGSDSIFRSVSYKKLTSGAYIGLIREDLSSQSVFFIAQGDTAEQLLYCFKASVNDTLPVYSKRNNSTPLQTQSFYMVVDSISITKDIQETSHRVFYLSTLCKTTVEGSSQWETIQQTSPELWVEGIGGQSGFLDRSCDRLSGSPLTLLLCVFNNDTQIYHFENNFVAGCRAVPTVVSETKTAPINCYTSQDHSLLTVSNLTANCTSFELYDIQGRRMIKQNINSETLTVNTADLQGIYFVRIIKTSKEPFVTKVAL